MALLIIVLLPLPILLWLLQRRRKSKSVRSPTGPRGLPLICNVHQFDISNPPQYLWKLSKQYGPLLFLRLGFLPVLVVSSANMAKEVFKTHHLTFSSRPALLGQRTLSYNFLHFAFSPYCAYWKECLLERDTENLCNSSL